MSEFVCVVVLRTENYEYNGSVETDIMGVYRTLDSARKALKEFSNDTYEKLLVDFEKEEILVDSPNEDYKKIVETNNGYVFIYDIVPTTFND